MFAVQKLAKEDDSSWSRRAEDENFVTSHFYPIADTLWDCKRGPMLSSSISRIRPGWMKHWHTKFSYIC
jgi:hypothetical protein